MNKIRAKIIKTLKSKRGFTLMEVLVALGLLGIMLPLTFELFNLGASLMARSSDAMTSSGDVVHTVQSELYTEGELIESNGVYYGADGIEGLSSEGMIRIENVNEFPMEIFPFELVTENGQTKQVIIIGVDYKGAKKGDVVYYYIQPKEE